MPQGGQLTAGLVEPKYDEQSLSAVLPAIAHAMGVDTWSGELIDPRSAANRFGLQTAQRVCVVLVDGLGAHNLEERLGHARTLRSLAAHTTRLTVGFPSTTASSMGSFGTGTGPGMTGMLGYTARNLSTGGVGNMISWAGMEPPGEVQRQATLFEHLTGAGTRVTSIGPSRFSNSGLTGAALRGATHLGADTPADRVDAALSALRKPGLTYLYWGEIDKAGHRHGWGSPEWGDALSEFDSEFTRLLRCAPRDTLVILTADHGMIDIGPNRWDIAAEPQLNQGIAVVAGEPRATHLFLESAAQTTDVIARWTDTLGDAAVLRTREQAIAEHWFGPVAQHVEHRIPDIIVAATGAATIVDSASQTPASLQMIGVHGSLTPHEMHVPLLVERT